MPTSTRWRTPLDAFTNPSNETYLTRKLFIMPLDTGGIYGVALSQPESKYLFSVYTLIIAGILGFVWQLVIYLALIFYPTEEGGRSKDQEKDGVAGGDESDSDLLNIRKRKANRYIALVMIWNAPNPWAAAFQLYGHAFTMIFNAKDKGTSLCDIVMIVIAITVGAATAAASTLVPAHLQKGAFAPANPKAVFYLSSVGIDDKRYVKYQQTKGAAGQRAIGIVEFASGLLQEYVNVNPPEVMNWTGPNREIIERTTYNYSVTGLGFGLQHKNAVNLVLSVSGACTLEYNWFNPSTSNDSFDVYNVYGNSRRVNKIGVVRPTGGTIVYKSQNNNTFSSNNSYAIIPDTVGRLSLINGTDPFYTTGDTTREVNGIQYQVVKDRRPVLSCWQHDNWSYKGKSAQSIADMGSLPGLDLPNATQNIIADRLTIPIICDIGASLGDSILISSQGGRSQLFDASIANSTTDLKRLIYASYVATQNILRDTTMISQTYELKNSAQDDSGVPLPGVGQFVIASGDVVALSVKNMTFIPLVWLLLWVIRFIASFARYTSKNSGPASRLTLRAVALQPVQMYRLLDEQVCGYRDDWFSRKGKFPYIENAQPWPGNRSQASENEETKTPITTEISTVEPAAKPPVQLFAAPKVVQGLDEKYQLGFAGPVRRMQEKSDKWVWFRPSLGDGVVVDHPDGQTPKSRWWGWIFGLESGGGAIR